MVSISPRVTARSVNFLMERRCSMISGIGMRTSYAIERRRPRLLVLAHVLAGTGARVLVHTHHLASRRVAESFACGVQAGAGRAVISPVVNHVEGDQDHRD